MPNPPNVHAIMAEKRFEALVKKEMLEHQHIISSHQKEMQTLRESLSLAMEKVTSISDRNDKEFQEFRHETTTQISRLKDRIKTDEVLIIEQRKMIDELHQQILGMYVLYASKTDLEKLRSNLGLEIKASTLSHLNSFQEFQREFKSLIQSLKNDQLKLQVELQNKLAGLADKGENNFSVSQIDKDAVLREIRNYKKDMFYIEKKIENIYTLIERLTKRVEICPKPV